MRISIIFLQLDWVIVCWIQSLHVISTHFWKIMLLYIEACFIQKTSGGFVSARINCNMTSIWVADPWYQTHDYLHSSAFLVWCDAVCVVCADELITLKFQWINTTCMVSSNFAVKCICMMTMLLLVRIEWKIKKLQKSNAICKSKCADSE
jgi:hypothetical protein